ncbi:MAG: preprotein translocase subunit SecG [Spirochaetota bacterium]
MGILSIFLLVILVIVCVLLVFVVVIQNEGAEGLGGIFAGSSNSAFGSRSSTVIQRFTYVLGALFFVCSFSLALLDKGSMGNVEAEASKVKVAPTASEWWNGANQAPATPAPADAASPGTPAPATDAPPAGK